MWLIRNGKPAPPRLPSLWLIEDGDKKEWYYFTDKENKNKKGGRTVPNEGHWKVVGVGEAVKDSTGQVIGFKQGLDFYEGDHKTSKRSIYKMHEYLRLTSAPDVEENWVLCRIYINKRELNKMNRRHVEEKGDVAMGKTQEGPSTEFANLKKMLPFDLNKLPDEVGMDQVPDEDGRLKLIREYTKNIKLDKDANLQKIAKETIGYNEAALYMLCAKAAANAAGNATDEKMLFSITLSSKRTLKQPLQRSVHLDSKDREGGDKL